MKLKSIKMFLTSVFVAAMLWMVHQAVVAYDIIVTPGYGIERIFTPALQFPENIAVSPSGVIVVFEHCTEDTGHRIVRVHEDGTLSTYGDVISKCYRAIAFDAASNLYAVDHDGALYRITPEGETSQVATGVAVGDLAVGPSGDIFAANSQVIQRITPEGQVSFFANNASSRFVIDVHPITGDVYIGAFEAGDAVGSIYRVNHDGTVDVLTSGTMSHFIAFADDGTLYHNDEWSGLYIVSTEDGSLTEVPWVRESVLTGNPRNIDVDSQGRVVSVEHGYGHVFRFNLETETFDVVYQNTGGNSTALAVAPNGGSVYIGVSYPSINGSGRVLRIEEDGSLTTVINDLPPRVDYITFDAKGVGYIGCIDNSAGWLTTIYTTTLNGFTDTLTTIPEEMSSMVIDPTTGYLWGADWHELWYLDDNGERHIISYPGSISDDPRPKPAPSLAITPDGTIYVRYSGTQGDIPVEQGVYRVDPAGPSYELVADLSSLNLCCVGGWITAGSDGSIYWIGDGDRYTPDNELDFYMLRITPSGEVTLIGRHLPLDPFGFTGDPNSTDLYFVSGTGVYRVFETEMIFLPLVLKSSD
jgi:sugar lactone lactonase YvrE